MSNWIIGSARHDENGKYTGGKKGDQDQKGTNDYKGEVSFQEFYVHKKGWYILRAKDDNVADKLHSAMITACNNANIGYSQSDRYGILKVGTATKTKCNCDCSSLVRQCIKEASGKDLGDFSTEDEADVLVASKLFTKIVYKSGVSVKTGDILVTRKKGHTVIVTKGDSRGTNKNKVQFTQTMNVRKTASILGKVIGTAKANTTYIVTKTDGKWLYINGLNGWVSNKYAKEV